MKRDSTETFNNEINSRPRKKNYPTNRLLYNDMGELRSFHLI